VSRNKSLFRPEFGDFGVNQASKSDFLRIQPLVFLLGLPEIAKAANMFGLKQAQQLSFSLFWSRDVRGRQGKKEYR
jgi:hypothetical protein